MYRLLIVSNKQNIKEDFSKAQVLDLSVFKEPHFRTDMAGALECMCKHAIDAVAIDSDPELDEFRRYMDDRLPNMPIFHVSTDVQTQKTIFKELGRLLNRLYADDSNLLFDVSARMEQQREKWLKKAISGMISSTEVLQRQAQLYRYKPGLFTPSILARFAIPEDDDFLSNRWHYGSDRLDTALLNFFGTYYNGMYMHVAVVSPQEVRVLCVPNDMQVPLREDVVYDYIEETAEQIDNYLGLRLQLIEMRQLPGLKAFSQAE